LIGYFIGGIFGVVILAAIIASLMFGSTSSDTAPSPSTLTSTPTPTQTATPHTILPPYTIISFNGVHFIVAVPENSTEDELYLIVSDIRQKYEIDTPIIDFFDDKDVALKRKNGYYDMIPEGDPRIRPYYMHWLGQYSGREYKLYYFNYSERLKNAQEGP
jgi:hypothetical protein